MKIKKPKWIDDNPHRAGKRLSNIYWGEHPVWKRDEEVLKWSDLDKEMIIYSHTFIYMHRGTELSRESFKTQGSQNVVYHIPNGYILKDSTFKPKPHGVNRVEIVKESYKLKFKLTHPNIATPIEIVIKKPENVTMTVADARNEIIANPGFPSGYDVDITNFNEFPDELVVNNDFSFNVPLKVGTAVPKPVKKVTIKYYLVDDNGDQTVYKTETGRYLDGSFDYNISIPVGYEQTNRVDNTDTTTSIYIRVKVFNVYIRMATYKNGNINQVWHSYNLTRKYNETVTQSDLQPLPENLKVGTAPNLFKVTLSYPDGFVFNTRTITEDTNIDIAIKASLKMIELLSEVDVPRITEAGIGVYTYGLPTGIVKPGDLKTVKIKFVANSIGLENGEKAFAAVFPYNPVKQMIIGNGTELVTGKNINLSIVKSPDFIQKLKTDFSGDLNGIPNDLPKYELVYIGHPDSADKYADIENYLNMSKGWVNTYLYVSDNFHKDEINDDRTLVSKWNYRLFDKEFDWTLFDNSTLDTYDKSQHKCWIIISNIVIHQVQDDPNSVGSGYKNIIPKSIASGIPYTVYSSVEEIHSKMYSRSVHGTLPTIQIYERCIDMICPLTIKNYRYYLCDNAKDFITDVEYKLKNIEDLHGTSDKEGYNRNIIAFDTDRERRMYEHPHGHNRTQLWDHYHAYNKNDILNLYRKKESNSDYTSIYNNFTSIIKDNPFSLYNKYTYFLALHKARNWWKYMFREDLIDSSMLESVKKHETNMFCYNFWDMVNHAIAKSLQRNHTVDNRLLTAVGELDKNAVIKVNMHLLPVCIDISDEKFPEVSIDMREEEFRGQTFTDKNPIIVYSPVNVKRVLNGIPRVTFFREPGKMDNYNPFLEFSETNRHRYYLDLDFDYILSSFMNEGYGRVARYSYHEDFNAIASHGKLYNYRPEIFYRRKSQTEDNYRTDLYELDVETLFNINNIDVSGDKIRTNRKNYYVHYIYRGIGKSLQSNTELVYDYTVQGYRHIYISPYQSSYIDIAKEFIFFQREYIPSDKIDIAVKTKYKEIIDYNKTITIFDNWKEEVSYDNPQ